MKELVERVAFLERKCLLCEICGNDNPNEACKNGHCCEEVNAGVLRGCRHCGYQGPEKIITSREIADQRGEPLMCPDGTFYDCGEQLAWTL